MSVVPFAYEGMGQGMTKPRFPCACSLIQVARILVQKRRQYGAPNHDVAEAIRGIGAIPFAEALSALAVVRGIACLLDSGKERDPKGGDRIASHLEREPEFQLS